MSSYRRRRQEDNSLAVIPTEDEFADLLYDAIPDISDTKDIYDSIRSGKNRGFKNLRDAKKALNDKLKFDRSVKILEDQLNDGGTVAIEAKGKLGQLLISPENASYEY